MSNQSQYCYPGTDILINLHNIKDQRTLTNFESMAVTLRNTQLGENPIKGNFNLEHLQRIHFFLFQDVYPFAGEIRNENIWKDGYPFARVDYIIPQAEIIFRNLSKDNYLWGLPVDEFSKKAANYMAELNVLHPFREGNGRTQREFIRYLALNNKYLLNWSGRSREDVLKASIHSKYDESFLARVIHECISEVNRNEY